MITRSPIGRMSVEVRRYDGNRRVSTSVICPSLDEATHDNGLVCRVEGTEWETHATIQVVPESGAEARDVVVRVRLGEGSLDNAAIAVLLHASPWSASNYVLVPGSVYDGNRMTAIKVKYPTCLTEPDMLGPLTPEFISDVPRLTLGAGPSRIQQTWTDGAMPAAGFLDAQAGRAVLLQFPPANHFADPMVEFEESEDRASATLGLVTPAVREGFKCDKNSMVPSDDRGRRFLPRDEVCVRFRLWQWPADTVQALFDRLLDVRGYWTATGMPEPLNHSRALALLHEKYARDNWVEPPGYFASEIMDRQKSAWLPGWVGGLPTSYGFTRAAELAADPGCPMLQRSLRHLQYSLGRITAAGFFDTAADGREWQGESNFPPQTASRHLVRATADGLYYAILQIQSLQRLDPSYPIPGQWRSALDRIAGGLATLWERYGQLGQFVDRYTGDLVVGGSASAAISAAALAQASRFLDAERYLQAACAFGDFLYRKFVQRGVLNGGPGEAGQAADSESCYGALESFITLYEFTGDREWVQRARDVAHQLASWVVPYDFSFPANSCFGQLNMRTTGAVYANAQNRVGTPGYCTYSGSALLRLSRITGDERYARLLAETTQGLGQYLSREDRPIAALKPGWMNERVQLNDWQPCNQYGVFQGSCWCELSLLLSAVDVPGLYVDPVRRAVCTFDHLEVERLDASGTEDDFRIRVRGRSESRMPFWVGLPSAGLDHHAPLQWTKHEVTGRIWSTLTFPRETSPLDLP